MTPAEIIRKAIPDASDIVCDHILWGRTPFPMGAVTTRSLYAAADRYRRASANHRQICDGCDNLADPEYRYWCTQCGDAMAACRDSNT